ncbi:proteasome activator pa28 REG alpha beta subunit [Phlebopus sp. FC_14]|nr:proteasome activator pa28 REG alpha beta subunit [Phlebopus sp. FC_14]
MSMTKEAAEKLQDFRTRVASVAEDIIFQVFPAKIIELTATVESADAEDSPFHISHAPPSTDAKVYPLTVTATESNGPPSKRKRAEDGSASLSLANDATNARYPELVHANKHLLTLQETIKKECAQLSDCCDKVKLWVNLTMPKIEDGDNFDTRGVRQNHLARAKICSKLIKYPNIEDYTFSLMEHDEKQLFFARQNLTDIRNIYAVMADILHKNIAKIRSPRGNNRAGLY